MISGWLKAVKDRALTTMLNGGEIPGYKVVAGKSSRDWSNANAVEMILIDARYPKEDYCTQPVLLSPYQLEKSIGKKKVNELVGSYIVSKPGGPTVALASDKRPAYDRQDEIRKDFM